MRIFLSSIFLSLLPVLWAQDAVLSQKILANLEEISERPLQFQAQAKLLSQASGRSTQTELQIYVDRQSGSQRSIGKVLAPTRSRGQIFLNNISAYWIYYPKLKRSVSLSPLSTLAGDVSIGDILAPPSLQIYSVKVLNEDKDSVQLELRKTAPSAPYSRVVQSYKGELLSEAEFYGGQDGTILMKRAQYLKPVQLDQNYFYTQVKIINELQKGSYTLIAFSTPKILKIPVAWFNPNNLQQVR